MKRLAGVFAVVSLALAGCGGSTCEQLESAFDHIAEAGKACSDSSVGSGTFSQTTCDANFEKCTNDEQDALADYASCLNDVDECKAGNSDAFDGAVLGCVFAAAGRISDTCDDAVFGASIRPPLASFSR